MPIGLRGRQFGQSELEQALQVWRLKAMEMDTGLCRCARIASTHEHQEMPFRAKDSERLGCGPHGIKEVLKCLDANDSVERVVSERQLLGDP
jgi:hypothetical protein